MFISHSFLDKKLILTLIDLFNNAGYSVYVDWIDDKNLDRNNVSPKTANVIKNRISNCKGYLISPLEILLIQNGVHGNWVWQMVC